MNETGEKIIELCKKHEHVLGTFTITSQGELRTELCPFCHGGDTPDKYTFGISLYNGVWSCLRGSCGKTGKLKDFCDFLGETIPASMITTFAKPQKQYTKPDETILKPLSNKAKEYLKTRCISEDTMNAFKLASDQRDNIVFPFYKDGEFVFAKIRRPIVYVKGITEGPKEWQIPNCKPALFGMDNASFNRPLYITEGEIDAMSLYEAGITNVVSVPSGCKNLEFINTCWDYLEKFKQIVVFGDNDEPGRDLSNILTKKLGEDRCMTVPDYPAKIIDGKESEELCKDANEILVTHGPIVLKQLAESCEPIKIKGIIDLSTIEFVDPTMTPRIYTRIETLDDMIGGIAPSTITVFTGKRSHGKSTLNGQIALNAISQGYKVCAYSGEMDEKIFLSWIMLQATERKYIDTKIDKKSGKHYPIVGIDIQKRIREWLAGSFYLFDNSIVGEEEQTEAILRIFTTAARRFDCNLFIVDNLMIALMSGAEEENRMQAKFMSKLKAFAVKYNARVLVVAHPRKTKPGESLNNDDISGSSAISNIADTVISVEKPNLRVLKNRETGSTGLIECSYDPANRRIFETAKGDHTVYGWDHNGILLPQNPAASLPVFEIKQGIAQSTPF